MSVYVRIIYNYFIIPNKYKLNFSFRRFKFTYFNKISPIIHNNTHIKTIIYIYHYSMAKETKKG